MLTLLWEVFRLLGCHGDLPLLVDYIMDQFGTQLRPHPGHAHPSLWCEYLLLLSQILVGGVHKGCGHKDVPPTNLPQDEMFVMIEGIITRLVMPDIWSHDTHNATSDSDLFTFLLVHTIFTCVHVLGVNFDPLLQQVIYPLMQKLGDRNVGVANAAMATLQAVCSHCGYG